MRLNAVILLCFSAGACGSGTLVGDDGGGGTGGGGGASACAAVVALERSCTATADCVAVLHTINCCGQGRFIGIRASEQARYQVLEPQCDQTYPACGCAAQQPFTDDGSSLRFGDAAGVACVEGVCTTYVPACRGPCRAGTTCFSCSNLSSVYAECTTACANSGECTDATLPLCQSGASGNTQGMFCTAAGVACDTR